MKSWKKSLGWLTVLATLMVLMVAPITAQADEDEGFTNAMSGEGSYFVTFYEDSSCSTQIGTAQAVFKGGELTSFEQPPATAEGESFLCWIDKNSGREYGEGKNNSVNSELKLYPKYTKSYLVTFQYQGEEIQQIKVKGGQVISTGTPVSGDSLFPNAPDGVPYNATKVGWYQAYRYSDGTIDTMGSEITEDTVVNSDMTVDYVATYTITFNPNHSDTGNTGIDSKTVEAGVDLNISAPSGYTREKVISSGDVSVGVKYQFQGWRTGQNGGGDVYEQNISAEKNNGDKPYYAHWVDPTEGKSSKYTITFERGGCENASDDIVVADVIENAVILELPTVTKVGYTFTNQWQIKNPDGNLGATWIAKTTPVTSNVTLVPFFSQQKYTVRFKGAEGVIGNPITVNHGEKVKKPETVQPFIKSMTLVDATGRTKVCEVRFTATGDWFDDGNTLWDFESKEVKANLTLTAQYRSEIIRPGGGGDGGGTGDGTGGGDGDGTGGGTGGEPGDEDDFDWDSAQIPSDPYDMVTVTFKPNNGDEDKSFTIKKGNTFSAGQMSEPEKAKNTFQFWSIYQSGLQYDFGNPINQSTTLYAVWKEDVTIVFNSDGGNYVSLKTIPYDTTITPPGRDPVNKHHEFLGWAETRQEGKSANQFVPVNFETKTFIKDKQVLWGWYESNTKINFHFGYGDPEEVKQITIQEGGKRRILAHAPEEPIFPNQTNRIFEGWHLDSSSGTLITESDFVEIGVTTDLYARWVKGFVVTFESSQDSLLLNGAKVISYRYVSDSMVTSPEIQVNGNQKVEGWYLDKACTEKADFKKIAGDATDVTVYAKWENVPSNSKVKIIFDATEGRFSGMEYGERINKEIVMGNLITSDIIPSPPAQGGLFFGQWYLDSKGRIPVKFSEFRPATDTTLYARWVCKMGMQGKLYSR